MVMAAVALTVGIVVVLAVFVFAIPSLTESGKVKIQLGDDRFEAGPAEARAASISEDGPILFSDVSSGQRDIYLQHVGDDSGSGWFAFDARRPGQGRDCVLHWERDPGPGRFVDPCDGEEISNEGAGLAQYEVSVEDGEVIVDILGVDTDDG